MKDILAIKETLVKSAQTIRQLSEEKQNLIEENKNLVKKSSFEDPGRIKQVLLDSAKRIRDLESDTKEIDGLREKVASYENFKKALSVSEKLAQKGLIPYEEIITKTANMQDSTKLDSIIDTIDYMGDSSVEKLFGAEIEKIASGELTGDDAAREFNEWVIS